MINAYLVDQMAPRTVQAIAADSVIHRFSVRSSDARSPAHPDLPLNQVTLRLRDGPMLVNDAGRPAIGSPSTPMSAAQLRTKFMDRLSRATANTGPGLGERLLDLASVQDVGGLLTAEASDAR